MAAKRSPAEEDRFQAWVHARNCLLYEADGGPDVNAGTEHQPVMITHAEAIQVTYAKHLLLEFDADLARLQAAAHACQDVATASQEELLRLRRAVCPRALEGEVAQGGRQQVLGGLRPPCGRARQRQQEASADPSLHHEQLFA
jgi:hypothetical protein